MGMLLSVPMIVAGIGFVMWARRHKPLHETAAS
jgi:prolipoprotein diacylglyceryltransferase